VVVRDTRYCRSSILFVLHIEPSINWRCGSQVSGRWSSGGWDGRWDGSHAWL